MQFGFAKAHHRITPRKKWAWPWAVELPKFWDSPLILLQRLKLATSNLVCSLGLPRPVIESHPEENVGVALGYGAPQIWGSLLIFLQRLKLATSKLAGWWGLPKPIIKSHSPAVR